MGIMARERETATEIEQQRTNLFAQAACITRFIGRLSVCLLSVCLSVQLRAGAALHRFSGFDWLIDLLIWCYRVMTQVGWAQMGHKNCTPALPLSKKKNWFKKKFSFFSSSAVVRTSPFVSVVLCLVCPGGVTFLWIVSSGCLWMSRAALQHSFTVLRWFEVLCKMQAPFCPSRYWSD